MTRLRAGLDAARAPGPRPALGAFAAALALVALLATGAGAREHAAFAARAGLESAAAAAQVWAPDAALVYLENDEDLDDQGAAPRWGYLYFSPSLQKARAYSLRDGAIVVAEDLEMKFEAPPVATGWIDSGAALAAAEERAGRAFRREHEGRVSTMLLTRGTFQVGDPDATTWTIIYTSPHTASLFVMVDAAQGTVLRTWRG